MQTDNSLSKEFHTLISLESMMQFHGTITRCGFKITIWRSQSHNVMEIKQNTTHYRSNVINTGIGRSTALCD